LAEFWKSYAYFLDKFGNILHEYHTIKLGNGNI